MQANRFSRVCLEDAFRYAQRRKTFGKTLLEHPVIRWKLAEMARQIECTQAQLEHLTYQFKTMSKAEQNAHLAGDCALIKAHATKVFEYCAREAAQIFGGACMRTCVRACGWACAGCAGRGSLTPLAQATATSEVGRGSGWRGSAAKCEPTRCLEGARRSCWTSASDR